MSLRSVVPALLFLSLFLTAPRAFAGYFTTHYAYTFTPSQGPATVVKDTTTAPICGDAAMLGKATLVVTPSLVWTPQGTGDTPPPLISYIETSYATSWVMPYPVGVSMKNPTAADGLSDPQTALTGNRVGAVSYGTHATNSVSSSGLKGRTLSGGGTIILPAGFGGGTTSEYYMSYALNPVYVTLGGLNPANQVLTGQQITANLNGVPNGFTVTKYTWAISPATYVFKTYNEKAASNQLVPLGAGDLSGPAKGSTAVSALQFYDRAQENLTVTCTVSVTAPDGTSLSITATSAQISVLKPTAFWTTNEDNPTLGPQFTQTSMGFRERWDAGITVPAPFSGGFGCFAQLVDPAIEFKRQPTGSQFVNCYMEEPQQNANGTVTYVLPQTGLDTYFPYQYSATQNYPAGYLGCQRCRSVR